MVRFSRTSFFNFIFELLLTFLKLCVFSSFFVIFDIFYFLFFFFFFFFFFLFFVFFFSLFLCCFPVFSLFVSFFVFFVGIHTHIHISVVYSMYTSAHMFLCL